jgi:hypothetical protein
MELLLNDVRIGVRTRLRTPGFASVAILIMALGIGANVSLFTIVRSVLLNPLPYNDPSHLIRLYETISVGSMNSPYGDNAAGMFEQWKEHNQTLADLAIAGSTDYNFSGVGAQLPEVVHAGNISWNMLPLLGVMPVLGRSFTADDDKPSANPTALLSWGMWKRRFGGESEQNDPARCHAVYRDWSNAAFLFSLGSELYLSFVTDCAAVDTNLSSEKTRSDEDA